jgi:hypothetical protein
MKKIVILITFINASLSAVSQEDSTIIAKSNFDWGFTWFVGAFNSATITTRYDNLEKLIKSNKNLSKNQTRIQVSEFLPVGFGFRYKRFKINAEYTLPFDAFDEREVTTSTLSIVAGYDVLNGRNYRIYPYLGLGMSQNTFNPSIANKKTVDFKDLSGPNFGASFPILKNEISYIDFGFEYSYREKKIRNFGWYSRIGYRLAQKASPWKSNQLIITNAPTDKVNQLYLSYGVIYSINRKKQQPQP